MKKVYFVRHGESETNAGDLIIGGTAHITEKGREQAAFVAERCKELPLDVIISSTMNRAKETAEIISVKIKKPIAEYSDLFNERRMPSMRIGKLKSSPEIKAMEKALIENFGVPEWRFSDEENFADFKERSGKALDFLSKRPEENILVVTHGFFLRIIITRVLFGESLTGEVCDKFIGHTLTENTGITLISGDNGAWKLLTWNDHAHLG
ncbi:MAG: histidine phosphatase family protein [Candidatus Paceibacterota bacterium]|jgi:probable phosphoglycerate mutase